MIYSIDGIGIDKIEICDLEILEMDTALIAEYAEDKDIGLYIDFDNENVIKDTMENITPLGILDNGNRISSLTIKDSFFGKLTMSCKKIKGADKYPLKTKLSLSSSYMNNTKPLSVNELNIRLREIEKYLAERYKISLSLECAILCSIELSSTLHTTESYAEYDMVWKLIQNKLPVTRYGNRTTNSLKIHSIDSINTDKSLSGNQTFFANNSNIELIIYDKTAQLKEEKNIYSGEQLIRVEYKIKRKNEANRRLSSKVSDLNDDMIKGQFKKLFEYDIERQIKKYKEAYFTRLEEYIVNLRDRSGKGWITDFREDVRDDEKEGKLILFDLEDVRPIFYNKLYQGNKDTARKKYNNFIKSVKRKERFYNWHSNNNRRLNEIIDAIKNN